VSRLKGALAIIQAKFSFLPEESSFFLLDHQLLGSRARSRLTARITSTATEWKVNPQERISKLTNSVTVPINSLFLATGEGKAPHPSLGRGVDPYSCYSVLSEFPDRGKGTDGRQCTRTLKPIPSGGEVHLGILGTSSFLSQPLQSPFTLLGHQRYTESHYA
jgi:hypothetical protein